MHVKQNRDYGILCCRKKNLITESYNKYFREAVIRTKTKSAGKVGYRGEHINGHTS